MASTWRWMVAFVLGTLVILGGRWLFAPAESNVRHLSEASRSGLEPATPKSSTSKRGSLGVSPRPSDPASTQWRQNTAVKGELASSKDRDQRHDDDIRFFNLSKEELVELARKCEVRSDAPGPMTDEIARELGLSPHEIAAWTRAYERLREQERGLESDLHREVTGEEPPQAIEGLEMMVVMQRVRTEADDDWSRRLAEERAGLRDEADDRDLSPWERWKRLQQNHGEAFERELARELGAARARALRAANDGWPGSRIRHWGCPRDEN